MVKTYGEAYRYVKQQLFAEGEPQAAWVARELLSFASGIDAASLMGMSYEPIGEDVLLSYEAVATRILQGEPLAYVLGRWSFYGLDLLVTPDVLIPRDDTMAVVDLALERSAELSAHPKIIDLCTGSGCIGLALASKIPHAQVMLCDISDKALAVAEENVKALGLSDRATCRKADVLERFTSEFGPFDLVISNPPYITGEEMKRLQRSVYDYEPHMALYGGEDGLVFYRAIAENFRDVLRPNGLLCFEFGQGQETAVSRIVQENHFDVLELRKDYGDIVRALIAQKKERNHEYGNG